MQPLVSVIIPFYNCPYVGEAVQSALLQTYQNVEVIVVDDGSTKHQARLSPYADRIFYLGKANGGTASALNHGMRMASGKYVAWLSSDDRFYPHKIERQAGYMEASGARISHTDYHVIDGKGKLSHLNAAPKFPSPRAFAASLASTCSVNGCTVMMTKELIAALGWFNESLPYTHDYELWIRTVLSGIDFHYLNEPLTAYRRHGRMGSVRHYDRVIQEAQAVSAEYGPLLQAKALMMPG